MVTKVKYAGICNNCGRKSEFYIRCGSHSLQVCGTCAITLSSELMKAVSVKQPEEEPYDNGKETGLIQDIGKVPKTGGIV